MNSFRKELIAHEREHEKGANECLRREAVKKIEEITGSEAEVKAAA